MLIQRFSASSSKYEYGCDLRRLYPWPDTASPSWGSAIATVRPGEATTAHAHDELETFIVLNGAGAMQIGHETEELSAGDVVLIPRNTVHSFRNSSLSEPLTFITIFWDSPEARAHMAAILKEQQQDL